MARELMPYRDYLIWQLSSTAEALTKGVTDAVRMTDEGYSIRCLEGTIAIARARLRTKPSADVVAPRPLDKKEEDDEQD